MKSHNQEPEAELPGVGGDDSFEAGDADCVGAGEQLRAALGPIITTWKNEFRNQHITAYTHRDKCCR